MHRRMYFSHDGEIHYQWTDLHDGLSKTPRTMTFSYLSYNLVSNCYNYAAYHPWLEFVASLHVAPGTQISVVSTGTGSPLHADAHMTRFYFQLLSGKKLWRVLPPSEYWRAGPS